MKVVVNKFAYRHTLNSSFSFYLGSFEEVAALAQKHFENQQPGYRDGVITVNVPAEGFYAGIVKLKEGDKLAGEFKSRSQGEPPRQHHEAVNRGKMPAVAVELALYTSQVLAEDGDNDLEPREGSWEIVSINASPVEGPQPIEPRVLLYNHFGIAGGTKTNMTDEELVAQLAISVPFWVDKTNASSADESA